MTVEAGDLVAVESALSDLRRFVDVEQMELLLALVQRMAVPETRAHDL